MNTRRRIWIASASLVVTFGLLSAVICQAQPAPDPSLWNLVFNPSGQRVVPVVFYDSTTGILGLDTRGLNRLDDTPDYTFPGGPIGFDDVGLIQLYVFTPITGGTFFAPFDLPFYPTQFLAFFADYFGQRYSLNVNALDNANVFLWPGVYPFVQLPTNLTSSDFSRVDLALSFGPGAQGFGLNSNGVQVIPEPSLGWVWMAIAPCLLIARWPRNSFIERHTSSTNIGSMQCLPK